MNIVIIDDEILLSKNIEKMLVKQEYSVQKIHNYDDFLTFNFSGVDLILLDVSLQDRNGFDILQELKDNSLTSSIKIIMISGHSETDYKVKGLDMGADDYLVKPFAPEELKARIRANTRSENISPSNGILESGNIKFDTHLRIVFIDGKEVVFSKKEKALLEFFMKNEGKLISKQEIAQRFWKDKSFPSNDNIINVTLHYFRKKLGSSAKIQTQSGEGYIFTTT